MIREFQLTLKSIEKQEPVDQKELLLLFAPTGPLQETAIHNGWGEAYTRLAAWADAILG